MKNQKIYLGTVYSHPDVKVREARFEAVNKKCAELMEEGYIVFSPVSHSHPLGLYLSKKLILDFNFWMKQDLTLLTDWSDCLFVFKQEGWENSRGLTREIEVAKENNIPIIYV